jgi:3-deoxy-manno-octulosonate cytidylyltransferase (CMP-KDO synthetase)
MNGTIGRSGTTSDPLARVMADALLATLGHAPDWRREFFTETVENFVENSRPTTETPRNPQGRATCTTMVRRRRPNRAIISAGRRVAAIQIHAGGLDAEQQRDRRYFLQAERRRSAWHARPVPAHAVLRFVVPVVLPAGLPDSIRSSPVVAVIPSRYLSTRLPGKPLALIGGKTMVEHVHDRVSEARTVGAVVVATDDDRVATAVSDFGGTAVMTRGDHQTGTDRLAEVAADLTGQLVVNVQGDEPLVSPDAIDACVKLLLDHPEDVMGTLRRRTADPSDLISPGVVKLVTDAEGYALYFSRSAIPYVRPGQEPPVFWRHLGLYVYRRSFLLALARLPSTPLERAEGLEQLRALGHGYRIRTVETTADTVGVDTPEDLERVRRLLEAGVRT